MIRVQNNQAVHTNQVYVPTVADTINTFMRLALSDKSKQTIVWYRRRLDALGLWLGGERPIVDVMEVELAEYYAHLAGRSLSAYTIHGHVRSMRRWCRWMQQVGILMVDLSSGLRLPKLPRQGRKGISEKNLEAILDAARENVRDYALLMFLSSTGARRGGVAALRLADLNMDETSVRLRRRAVVREKGNKERVVVMDLETLKALEAWLLERPQVNNDYVFLGRCNGQEWRPISAQGISGIITRYKHRLGLIGPCSPHQWRHRWARDMLHRGMELAQVSQLLGHEDVSITVRFYGQFDIDQLQDAYDRMMQGTT